MRAVDFASKRQNKDKLEQNMYLEFTCEAISSQSIKV